MREVDRLMAGSSSGQLRMDLFQHVHQSIYDISPYLYYYPMNFFSSITRAVDKISSIGMLTNQSPGNYNGKKNPLTDLIRSCSYTEDTKFIIQKSIIQVIQGNPQYIVDKIEFPENGQLTRYIELKGQFTVDSKGKIPVNIMYPNNFPKIAPYIRIVNPNPQQFIAIPFFQPLQSTSDPMSYVLNPKLQQASNWRPNSLVANLVIEVNNMMRKNFPFQMIKYPPQKPRIPFWGSNSQQGMTVNQWQNQNQNQPQPKQPPIPFKTSSSAVEIIGKAQILTQMQKNKLMDLKEKQTSLIQSVQLLHTSSVSVEAETKALNQQIYQMMRYMKNSQTREVDDFASILRPADEKSAQILELTSSIKAREDTIQLLQHKFGEETLSLKDFLKNRRKLQQARFEQKFMLGRCLQNIPHQ